MRKQLSAKSGVAEDSIVFCLVVAGDSPRARFKTGTLVDVLVDTSTIYKIADPSAEVDRYGYGLADEMHAFEVASPRWLQPIEDGAADAAAAPSYADYEKLPPAQRPTRARVLLLTEVYFKDSLAAYEHTPEKNFDAGARAGGPDIIEHLRDTSVMPLVLSVSRETTVAQLRLVAARQLFPLLGGRLQAHLKRNKGREVSAAETTRVLASIVQMHTHAGFTAERKAGAHRWLPGVTAAGVDAPALAADAKGATLLASDATIGSMPDSFICYPLKEAGVTHPEFVFSKLLVTLRGAVQQYANDAQRMASVEHAGDAEELAAAIERRKRPLQLSDCLRQFSEPEKLDDQNLYRCSRCKDDVRAVKTLEVWQMPSVVFVHLKRFTKQFRKLSELVDFPLEGLDLSPYMLNRAPIDSAGAGVPHSSLYDCIAVVNHHGGMGGGHYTAFANQEVSQQGGVGAPGLKGGKGAWWLFDDSHAAQSEPRSVVTPAAYVLVYQRRQWEQRLAVGQQRLAPIRAPAAPAPRPAAAGGSGGGGGGGAGGGGGGGGGLLGGGRSPLNP